MGEDILPMSKNLPMVSPPPPPPAQNTHGRRYTAILRESFGLRWSSANKQQLKRCFAVLTCGNKSFITNSGMSSRITALRHRAVSSCCEPITTSIVQLPEPFCFDMAGMCAITCWSNYVDTLRKPVNKCRGAL